MTLYFNQFTHYWQLRTKIKQVFHQIHNLFIVHSQVVIKRYMSTGTRLLRKSS